MKSPQGFRDDPTESPKTAKLGTLRKLYRDFLSCEKMEIFGRIFKNIFLIFAPKHRLWVLVRTPRRDGSNEYTQSMFWSKNKKNRYTPRRF